MTILFQVPGFKGFWNLRGNYASKDSNVSNVGPMTPSPLPLYAPLHGAGGTDE